MEVQKMLKKILSLVLCVCMLTAFASFTASAAAMDIWSVIL